MAMGLEIVQRISESNVQRMREHLETLKTNLSEDVSTYAKGRQRFWLEHEWMLKGKYFVPAIHDDRLWGWVKRNIWSEAELGLAAYGAVGIDLHRDDTYAQFVAYTINLGDVEKWLYKPVYPEWTWVKPELQNRDAEIQEIEVKSGDVIKFNCKNPHAPLNPAEDRWSINLWKVQPKVRAQFTTYLNKQEA